MASNTDTLPLETAEATRARRGSLTWAAVVGAGIAVAALGVITLRGGAGDSTPVTRFDPRAEIYEREAHIKGQATTYGRASAFTPSPPPSDVSGHGFVPGTRHMPAR